VENTRLEQENGQRIKRMEWILGVAEGLSKRKESKSKKEMKFPATWCVPL